MTPDKRPKTNKEYEDSWKEVVHKMWRKAWFNALKKDLEEALKSEEEK